MTIARQLRAIGAFTLSAAIGAGLTIAAWAQTPAGRGGAPNPAPVAPAAPPVDPLIKDAHWHDITINTTDPAASVAYYTRHFKARAGTWNGKPAVWTQRSWLLFNKVDRPAPSSFVSGLWHIGWGAPDPKAESARQNQLGVTWAQPLTDISTGLAGFRPDQFYYMYALTPEGVWVELNTANHNNFGHLHMFSVDPVATGDWWIRTFGVRGRLSTPQTNRAPRYSINGESIQVGPSASINFDNVNMIIYPIQYSTKSYAADWTNLKEIQSTRGRALDHIGVSVPDLDLALRLLREKGVKIVSGPVRVNDKLRTAWIEAPDRVAVQLLEDRLDHPPLE